MLLKLNVTSYLRLIERDMKMAGDRIVVVAWCVLASSPQDPGSNTNGFTVECRSFAALERAPKIQYSGKLEAKLRSLSVSH